MNTNVDKVLVVTSKVEYSESDVAELIKRDAAERLGCNPQPMDDTQVLFEFIECTIGGINGAKVTVIERIPANRT